jgi:DNA-binding GntR family transcriptional regulator
MATSQGRLRPVNADSLVELAYDSIRRSILASHFKPGEHLVESRIAGELEISRAPVREAMRRLSQEGLTVEKPRRGTFVSTFDAKALLDIYNSRIAIETAAVRLTVRNGAQLDSIEETIEALSRAGDRGDVPRVIDLDMQVHEGICEASGNEYLASIFRSLAGPIRVVLGVDAATVDDLDEIGAVHLTVLEALRSGDADRAVEEVERHIYSSVGPLLERFGRDPDELMLRIERN